MTTPHMLVEQTSIRTIEVDQMADPKRPHARYFADFISSNSSADTLRIMERALPLLDQITEPKIESYLAACLEAFKSPRQIDKLNLSSKLGMEEEVALQLVTFGALLVLAARCSESPEEIVTMLSDRVQMSVPQRAVLKNLIERFRTNQETIERSIEKQQLANAVLPAFEYLRYVIDMRIDYDEETPVESIPVLIAYLRTDASAEHIWFQLSSEQVEQLIQDLSTARKMMQNAEKWFEGKNSE